MLHQHAKAPIDSILKQLRSKEQSLPLPAPCCDAWCGPYCALDEKHEATNTALNTSKDCMPIWHLVVGSGATLKF